MHDDEEYMQVVKKHNRVLRKVNKHLRNSIKGHKEYSDNLFITLCESNKEAVEALERIRVEGGIDCDTDDYENIIFECLKALKFQSNNRS